jgi:hypothetical protein
MLIVCSKSRREGATMRIATMNRMSLAALASMLVLASGVGGARAQPSKLPPKGTQCYALIGQRHAPPGLSQMTPTEGTTRGTLLLEFVDGGRAHAYWWKSTRSPYPYDAMAGGAKFAEVAGRIAAAGGNKGELDVTLDKNGNLVIKTTSAGGWQNYEMTIDPDGKVLGKAESPNGSFSLEGKCG